MPKFCKYCGSPLQEGAKFCTGCGHPVAQSAQPQPSYTQQPPQQAYAYGGQPPYRQPQKKKKGGCCLVALIVLLVMLAALGIGGYFFYKFANDKFEDTKEMIEETIGVPLSTIISSENREELEKPVVTSEDIDKPNKAKKGKEGKKIAVKDEDFFGVVVPIPDIGVVSQDVFQGDSTARSVYFNDISYEQFIDYCKQLEALPGWKADSRWNVANLSEDHNERSARCVGEYQSMYVSLEYYDDEFAERSGGANFRLYVTSYE